MDKKNSISELKAILCIEKWYIKWKTHKLKIYKAQQNRFTIDVIGDFDNLNMYTYINKKKYPNKILIRCSIGMEHVCYLYDSATNEKLLLQCGMPQSINLGYSSQSLTINHSYIYND